jgi:hypothetical protein
VRYEDDGWFAGWWGHNFDLVSTGTSYIDPDFGLKENRVIFTRSTSDGFTYYMLQQKDKGVSLSFSVDGSAKWNSGTGTIARVDDTTVQINGSTTKGDTFVAEVDAYTGELLSFTSSNVELVGLSVKEGNSYKLNVEYGTPVEYNYTWLRRDQALEVKGVPIEYTRDAAKSKFGELFELTDDNVLSVTPAYLSTFALDTYNVEYAGTLQEYVKAAMTLSAGALTTITFTPTDKWIRARFNVPTLLQDYVNDTGQESGDNEYTKSPLYDPNESGGTFMPQAVNKQTIAAVARDPTAGYKDPAMLVYKHAIPVWLRFSSKYTLAVDTSEAGRVKLTLSMLSKDVTASLQAVVTDNAIIKSRWQFQMPDVSTVWFDVVDREITFVNNAFPTLPSLPLRWSATPPPTPDDPYPEPVEITEANPPPTIIPKVTAPIPDLIENPDPQLMVPNPVPGPPEYTITFDSQGGTDVQPVTLYQGADIYEPERPELTDMYFLGWFTQKDPPVPPLPPDAPINWDPTYKIIANVTLYARWSDTEPDPPLPDWIPGDNPPPYPVEIPDPDWTPFIQDPGWVSPDVSPNWIQSPNYPPRVQVATERINFRALNGNDNYPIAVDGEFFRVEGLVTLTYSLRYFYTWETTEYVPATIGWAWDVDPAYNVPVVPETPVTYKYNSDLNEWQFKSSTRSFTKRVFTQQNYTDKVTVYVDTDDANLVGLADIEGLETSVLALNIPQVINGWTVLRFDTLDLYTESLESFAFTKVKNSDYTPALKLLRIDDNGGEGLGDYALRLVEPEFAGISNKSSTECTLSVVLNSAEGELYSSDNHKYAYPAFVSADGQAKNVKAFQASQKTYTAADIITRFEHGAFITDSAFKSTIPNGNNFTNDLAKQLGNMSCVITRVKTVQTLLIKLDGNGDKYLIVEYNAETGVFTVKDATHMTPYIFNSFTGGAVGKELVGSLNYTLIEALELLFYRAFIYANSGVMIPAKIVEQKNGIVTLSDNLGKIDLSSGKLTDSSEVVFAYSEVTSLYAKTFVKVNNIAEAVYLPKGIFYSAEPNVEYVKSASTAKYNTLTFIFEDVEYTAYIDVNATTDLIYSTTDIRNGEYKPVYKRSTSDIYMYVKQFWATTVDVENYWWIDETHVFELSKYYATLYKKVTGEVDDWMGDRWEIQQRVPRQTVVSTKDLYYSVSCAYNGLPVLFKLQAELTATNLTIKYVVFQPTTIDLYDLNDEAASNIWTTLTVPVTRVNLGSALAANGISSYTQLNPAAMIGAAKISATHVESNFLLGIYLNAGLQQWTLRIKNGALIGIINGYGCVGIDGALTGGEIPDVCCSATAGFKEPVYSLNDLPAFGELPDKCYGTGSQVWFVYKTAVNAIVSHFTFKNGAFTKVLLELNNNVANKYTSGSFMVARLFDYIPQPVGISTIMSAGGGDGGGIGQVLSIVSAVALPNLYVMNMAYGYLHFINHASAQYAYVWRNALQGNMRSESGDPTADATSKTSKDVVFSQTEYSITYADELSPWGILVDIVLKGVAGLGQEPQAYKVNAAQNQTAPDMDGPKGSAFTVMNVASTVASAILASGVTTSMGSVLTEMYNLSMFYSISDKTQCFAGPGYVNHNLTAQCVAQSVMDTQVDGKKIGYFCVMLGLSLAVVAQQKKLMAYTREFLLNKAAAISGASFTFGTNPGATTTINYGQAIAAALEATAAAALALLIVYELCEEYILPAFAKMLGAEVGEPSLIGLINKRNLDAEGTHSYGNKPMSFFWPAFGVETPVAYTDERVDISGKLGWQNVQLAGKYNSMSLYRHWKFVDNDHNESVRGNGEPSFSITPGLETSMSGRLYTKTLMAFGRSEIKYAPENMAIVEGITTFLPNGAFKAEQIGLPWPTFPPAPIHDYMINKEWSLGVMATYGAVAWVSQDDTKLLDGPPSNVVIKGSSFCGVASSYTAIEVKNAYDARYLRPHAITPNAIALNINRYNCVHDAKAYHAFDGQGNRIVNWRGSSGMDKNYRYLQYCYQINDHFKRSNIIPPSDFFGEFQGPPSVAIRSYERVANLIEAAGLGVGYGNPIPGEDKDLRRYSLPVHSDPISTLPAMVRMLAPYKLAVVDGVTSLVTELRNTQTAYKAPSSTDFNINGEPYRATSEYINTIHTEKGIVVMDSIVAIAGLTFIGATTTEAFFYSPATRLYYSFSGGRAITKKDILNRFHDLTDGKWDFVNQEIIFKCLLGDNVLVCRLEGTGILGEVSPPISTIYNKRSGFRLLSVAGGLTYQGPKRFIVNRFILNEHMFADIKRNKRKWTRVSRSEYPALRDYGWEYEDFDTTTPLNAVKGWTHNPFEVVTAMLGNAEEDDGRFEWSLTFAWTEQMDALYEKDEYTTINVQAETVTQGGTRLSDVTHIFLYKECFTRQGCAGYYTFQFQSNNGIGNRERLILWGDGIDALESIELTTKSLTTRRTQILSTQVDVKDLQEM